MDLFADAKRILKAACVAVGRQSELGLVGRVQHFDIDGPGDDRRHGPSSSGKKASPNRYSHQDRRRVEYWVSARCFGPLLGPRTPDSGFTSSAIRARIFADHLGRARSAALLSWFSTSAYRAANAGAIFLVAIAARTSTARSGQQHPLAHE